jgi:LacI family transcriptional regulator
LKKKRAPTIKEVAVAAGVSLGTVSAVIHGRTTVNADIRQRVKLAIEKIGYSPNAIAQSMRSGSTRSVGILVRDISLPAIATFVSAAQDVFYEAGYATLIAISGDKHDREINLLNALTGRKVDGLLVSHQREEDTDLHALFKGARTPIVLVDREQPDWTDAVLVNHRDAIRRATEYLLNIGHQRIALLVGLPNLFPSRERIAGFEAAHTALGVSPDPELKKTNPYLAEDGYRETLLLVSSPKPPTAIIAGGPLLPGVLRALASRNLRIPTDVSIVATSNSDLAELTMPPISTERWDANTVGKTAARLLLERIDTHAVYEPRRIMLPCEFSLRDSCAPPRR